MWEIGAKEIKAELHAEVYVGAHPSQQNLIII